MRIARIISGGQSGVDRGALEAAVASAVAYGGWCPAGGWAEDWPAPPGVRAMYPVLIETPQSDPRQRTEWNVRDSDAVLALFDGRGMGVSAGTLLAMSFADDYGKPHIALDLEDPHSVARAGEWLAAQPRGEALNIVGPRESEAPGICGASRRFVMAVLSSEP